MSKVTYSRFMAIDQIALEERDGGNLSQKPTLRREYVVAKYEPIAHLVNVGSKALKKKTKWKVRLGAMVTVIGGLKQSRPNPLRSCFGWFLPRAVEDRIRSRFPQPQMTPSFWLRLEST